MCAVPAGDRPSAASPAYVKAMLSVRRGFCFGAPGLSAPRFGRGDVLQQLLQPLLRPAALANFHKQVSAMRKVAEAAGEKALDIGLGRQV